MKELIKRLRSDMSISISHQAADAIEQLQAERDELAAQVAVLREALDQVMDDIRSESYLFEGGNGISVESESQANKALSTTPPAALAALRAKHLEEAASLCDRFAEREMHPAECADAIRALT